MSWTTRWPLVTSMMVTCFFFFNVFPFPLAFALSIIIRAEFVNLALFVFVPIHLPPTLVSLSAPQLAIRPLWPSWQCAIDAGVAFFYFALVCRTNGGEGEERDNIKCQFSILIAVAANYWTCAINIPVCHELILAHSSKINRSVFLVKQAWKSEHRCSGKVLKKTYIYDFERSIHIRLHTDRMHLT